MAPLFLEKKMFGTLIVLWLFLYFLAGMYYCHHAENFNPQFVVYHGFAGRVSIATAFTAVYGLHLYLNA